MCKIFEQNQMLVVRSATTIGLSKTGTQLA